MFKRMLLCLILLPITLYSESSESLDKVVAIVNNDVITASELDKQTEALKKQILAKNNQVPADNILRKQVLQHLIDLNLQIQLAKNNNITIDDKELDAAIQRIADSNKITIAIMKEQLQKFGVSWEGYRENIRNEILVSQVQQKAVAQDVVVSSQQVDDYVKTTRKNNKFKQVYHVQNIVIPLPEEPTTEQLKKAEKKSEALLKKIKQGSDFSNLAIAESSGDFALEGGDLGERHLAEMPEIFADKVVDMKVGEVAGPIRTGNGFQLIKLVSIGGNNLHHEVVKTHVRHILLKQDANMTQEDAARQINNIYQQLKSGKSFAQMAKVYSMDRASGEKGGDLGWVNDEELVPEFVQAMNALTLNTISKPVQSRFGWHLIEVLERKTVDDSDAFEHQQVRQLLFQRKFGEAVALWQQHLRTDAFINILDKELA